MSNEQSAEKHDPAEEPAAESPQEAEPAARTDAEAPESAEAGEAEATASEAGEDTELEQLRQELEAARARADDYWDRLMRTEAEKENIRKRAERDADSARRYALEKFATELLAVRDSLELGEQAAGQDDADVAKLREGTELTLKMLTQAMEKFSIEEINPVGEKFNPELHQAMSMQEAEGHEPNTVVSVMQKGYRLNDRLLRPALVMVAK